MLKSKYIVLLMLCASGFQLAAQTQKEVKTLIVFFDGLRPDYINPELMPNLYHFKQNGSYGDQHHSVFPTVTRVNASSYATGSYPAKNGLMGNTVYFPEVDPLHGLNTGDAEDLMKITAATHNHLLTAISLGELVQQMGSKMMVFSSGSSGQAYLQNHTLSGGAIINTSMILPEVLRPQVINDLGAIPEHAYPNSAQHEWIANAVIKYALAPEGPLVSAVWFSDPDGTAHRDGIGTATANASIQSVDAQFGRILKALKDKGLTDQCNIIISADHGFVTDIGKKGVTEFLIEKGLKKDKNSDDVLVIGGAVYVKNHDAAVIKNIVQALQEEQWIGAIFTKASASDALKGEVAGTLSFNSIHWNHATRSADILVDANWNDAANAAGYKGSSFSRGVAGHGGFSPYEVHIPLIASGPSFKKAFKSELPTSNVDITPTILYLSHIKVPKEMDGRVMYELLKEKSPKSFTDVVVIKNVETKVDYPGGSYRLILQQSHLGNDVYNDFAKVIRE
ncbi:MAG: alkaline phosphatase family protein [Bacteroidetes bacterium]|nr:alkaline phosphatase family protein [Bacteroidota bacterium]MBU1372111.1 alkaline phosphatase family protein [Bacteroidota bacterium]MBU1484032.1 alkaline phosphatase family protein [Bacteroidota bacterium]MBU1760448.1 alkaline phosphatase family protein [Bacteroidota bacterium]MBU2268789.1 alkaline phosphatase family protein [Bacteroidota bacterium]